MKAYPQQHEPWQPANPPVWNHSIEGEMIDLGFKPKTSKLININLCAFFGSRNAINRAMKQ